jgi:hypothetical protein
MATAQVGYQGQIAAIQCGNGGLRANLNPSKIPLKNVIQAEGVVFREDHWRKEPGTALFGTNINSLADPADAVIVALNDWHPTESVQRIVHLRGDGKLYFTIANPGQSGDPGAFASTTTSGTGTRFGFFITGGQDPSAPTTRKLFLLRSNFLPTVVKGDVTNDVVISAPAVDWSNAHPPIAGVINNTRLWLAGNANNPHMLYASDAGDQENFTSSGFSSSSQALSMFPGVGERIFALANYQGFIVVFKHPFGIFLQDARDTDPLNWLQQQVTNQVGIAPTPYAALQLENDVLFLGSDGQFYLLSALISAAAGQNNMAVANLGMDLEIYQFLKSAYNRDNLAQIQSNYQPFWQTAQFTVPGISSNNNNTRLLFDFEKIRIGGEPRFSYSYRDQAASITGWRDPADLVVKPIYGDYSGNIILSEQDSRTAWDGAPYPMRVQTPHSNLGELELASTDRFVAFANRNKLWDDLEVEFIPFTNGTLTATIFEDGVLRETITLILSAGGKPLGFSDTDAAAFVIGTSALAGGNVRSVVRRLVGDSRRISILFENENSGEDVALTHLFLYFRVGDTTQKPRSGG